MSSLMSSLYGQAPRFEKGNHEQGAERPIMADGHFTWLCSWDNLIYFPRVSVSFGGYKYFLESIVMVLGIMYVAQLSFCGIPKTVAEVIWGVVKITHM